MTTLGIYSPTKHDIRQAMVEHGRRISMTKLQEALKPIAYANRCQYVDWHEMKRVVEKMYADHEVQKIQERQGYYRYDLTDRYD